jgi:sporulation protein YlmC with PRC-barrel domain
MDYTFTIGAPVLVEEGEIGRLRHVVVDPGEEVVTDLIVEQGRLLRRSIVVPVGWVQHADERGVLLNARLADLEELPTYREVEFEEPDPAKRRVAGYDSADVRYWITPYGPIVPRQPHLAQRVRLGVQDDAALIGRGARVSAAGGQALGTVDHLLVDPRTREVTHLVVHPLFRLGHEDDVVVPRDQIETLGAEDVRLRVPREEVERLPRYRQPAGDVQIERQVARTLETRPETPGAGHPRRGRSRPGAAAGRGPGEGRGRGGDARASRPGRGRDRGPDGSPRLTKRGVPAGEAGAP